MSDQLYISEAKALAMLTREGDFTETQARIVLGHSKRQAYDGGTYYPLTYIANRVRTNQAKPN